MIISDLTNPVISKIRQRTEYASFVPYYVSQALIDITQNIEFEDLKLTGPLTNFVEGLAEYPLKGQDPLGINGNPFVLSDDHKITFINSWFVYFDPSGNITLGQSTGKEIDARELRVVEPMSKVMGVPSYYCLYGSKKPGLGGKIIVGQMPNNPYACQMRYQRQHPFNIPYGSLQKAQGDIGLCNKLGQSEIYMDDDWTEIIILATAEKICDDIGMTEIGQLYHQKLYGYKDKRGNEFPGLITVRQTQQQRQSQRNSRALRPVVRRYT